MRTRSHLVSCTGEDFHSYVFCTKRSIERELEGLLSKISDVKLHPLLEFALLSKGKRLRPILTVLSAQSLGGDPKRVMQLALSFELLHTATLVHDDIIDQDTCRRGMKTLYSKWFMKGAVLAGDALIALSVNLASARAKELIKRNSGNGNVTWAVMEEVRDRMEEFGAFRYCERKIVEYIEKSHSSLKVVARADYLMRFFSYIDEFKG